METSDTVMRDEHDDSVQNGQDERNVNTHGDSVSSNSGKSQASGSLIKTEAWQVILVL